ncbi:hypothetical protein ACHAW6_002827 [Cyclotella cf. meneghiniana]
MWNSVISTKNSQYITADLKLSYLTAPMDRHKYMHMPLKIIPEHIIEQYNLCEKAKNGYVYMEIRRAMYGLPQAGILANRLLKQRLAKHGYYEVAHTPGLWKHISRPISFTLVVDDFGIKYVGKEHADISLQPYKNITPLTLTGSTSYIEVSLLIRTMKMVRSTYPCPVTSRNYSTASNTRA